MQLSYPTAPPSHLVVPFLPGPSGPRIGHLPKKGGKPGGELTHNCRHAFRPQVVWDEQWWSLNHPASGGSRGTRGVGSYAFPFREGSEP